MTAEGEGERAVKGAESIGRGHVQAMDGRKEAWADVTLSPRTQERIVWFRSSCSWQGQECRCPGRVSSQGQ